VRTLDDRGEQAQQRAREQRCADQVEPDRMTLPGRGDDRDRGGQHQRDRCGHQEEPLPGQPLEDHAATEVSERACGTGGGGPRCDR
jgi:hypothetical protein